MTDTRATPDPQPTLSRAIDLLRAFAMHPEHPDYKQRMLEIKGLLETTEGILQERDRFAAQHSPADPNRSDAMIRPDMCPSDDLPCYVGQGTDDAHWRCGTVQCGKAAAPVSGDLDVKLRAAATAREVLAPYWNGTSRLLMTTEWEDLRTAIAKAIYAAAPAAALVSGDVRPNANTSAVLAHQAPAWAVSGDARERASREWYNHISTQATVHGKIMALEAVLTAAEDKARREVIQVVIEWYERDGSVGGCSLMIDDIRALAPTPEKDG